MIEVNASFKEANTSLCTPSGGVLMITPPLNADYFIARVPLHKNQAIQIFPKFGIIGCGFAQEKDWNTNLPIYGDAESIYQHIKHNKRYRSITDAACIQAIKDLQAWVKEQGMWKERA